MSKEYDPKSAVLGMRHGMKMMSKKDRRERVPAGLLDVKGEAITPIVTDGPATTCVLLLAFLKRHPMVPDDFHNVERTKDGIEQYVRPDGGTYLGTFELPRDPGGAVLVYGNPEMSRQDAAAASLAYRRKIQESYANIKESR